MATEQSPCTMTHLCCDLAALHAFLAAHVGQRVTVSQRKDGLLLIHLWLEEDTRA